MRILFINRMLSMERGGGETFDLEIARHLQQLGCEVSFLSGIPLFSKACIPNPCSGFRSQASGFSIRSPCFNWFPWDKVKGGWRLRLADFWMFERRAVAWLAKHERDYDVIQVCELPYLVARAKRQGVSVPIVMRLTAPNFYDRWDGLQAADAVIASGETVNQVRETLRPDCHDIPNSVDTELFMPHESDFRLAHKIPATDFLVLYVARFQDFKNHALLLDAFARFLKSCPETTLALVGSGPLEPRVKAQAAALEIAGQVLFLGEQPFSSLPNIYAAADVMAISSDFESFCFAALEAMASGLPIVTTDCGWVPRLIGKQEIGDWELKLGEREEEFRIRNSEFGIVLPGGIVVPVRDAAALAKGLISLAGDEVGRKRMGEYNRKKAVTEHGWAASAGKLVDVYRTLIR
jgi:glycosyltransferase involved in cell wall biosynthesis